MSPLSVIQESASTSQKGTQQKVSDTRSVHMSKQELSRAQILRELDEGRIKQRHAAEQLKLSVRQVKRLLKTYRHLGDEG